MSIITSHIFLYIDSNLSSFDHQIPIVEFVNAGYSSSNIRAAKSILDVAAQIKQGSTIVVHSINFCHSDEELVALLTLLQDKNITLRSIAEPWLNIPIAEYMQSAAKMHKLIRAAFNNDHDEM